jgi:histone H3/H4
MIKRVGTVITNILILIVILLNLLILGYIGGLVIKHVLQKKGTEKPFLPAESTDPDGTLELDESSKNLEQIDTSDWERQYEILMAFEKKWQKTDTTIDRDLPEEKRMEEISGIVNKAIEEAFQISPHQLHEVLMKEAELYALMEKKKTEEDLFIPQEDAGFSEDDQKEVALDWERQYEILMAFEKKWQETDTTIDRDLPEEKRMEEISGRVNKAIEEAFQMSPHQLHEVLMKEAELYALMEKKKTEEDQKIIAVFNEKFEFHEMNNSQEKEDMTEKERKEQLRLRAVQDTAKELKIEEEHVQIVIGM